MGIVGSMPHVVYFDHYFAGQLADCLLSWPVQQCGSVAM